MRIIRKTKSGPKESRLESRFRKGWEFPPPGPYQPSGDLKCSCPMVVEHKFHPSRKWRFDFAWPTIKVAVEIQGGGFVRGKHGRGVGQQKDFEKLNEAQRLGWLVLQFGSAQLSSHRKTRQVINYVAQLLSERLARAKTYTADYIRNTPIKNRTAEVTVIDDTLSKHPPKPPKAVRRTPKTLG